MARHAPRRTPDVPVRRATLSDVDLLVAHRLAMFRDMGGRSAATLARHAPLYLAWLVPRLTSADVVAWVAEGPDGVPLGSGAVWFQPSHPRPGTSALLSPYILSVYTAPDARGRGVATSIVRQATALSKRLGYGRAVLHASPKGRRVYERLGFRATTEMRLFLDPAERRLDARRRAAEARRPTERP